VSEHASALLEGLDDAQRAVATATAGPVLVLAGAGTGKTRAITHRIAYAVATGEHQAQATLAVTFTQRAAGEMRARLQSLGVAGAQVRTFHSAALRQLRYFWPRLSNGEFPQLTASKVRLVSEAARRRAMDANHALVRDLASDIEWARANELDAATLLTSPTAQSRTWAIDIGEFAALMAAYEDIKAERGLMDFEDVLAVTIGALSTRMDIATEVRSAYRWFTVDEYQDVNPLQQRLLQLWLGDRDELCVVGDPSQTIYSFTGASDRYLSQFTATYPQATEVHLVQCYRCTEPIVQLANAVIAPGQSALTLTAVRTDAITPNIRQCADDPDEAAWIAGQIMSLIASGTPARQIAVLYRVNAQSAELESALAGAGIGYVMRGAEQFFDRGEVREAMARLRAAARTGITEGDLQQHVVAVLSTTGWTPTVPTTTGAVRERWESLAALVALAGELAEQVGGELARFVTELDTRAQAQHAPTADAVTLASLHAAKGLEWDAVFLAGASDGLIPLSHADTAAQLAEERRLLYVGITRARTHLSITWAGARTPGGKSTRNLSRFLAGLRPDGTVAPASASVRKGAGSAPSRGRKGPAKCRGCGKGLVTAAERTIGRCRTCPQTFEPVLLEQLKAWRKDLAREKGVPAYVICTDATLIAVAEQLPINDEQLLAIPGIGPAKVEQFGDRLRKIVEAGYPFDEG